MAATTPNGLWSPDPSDLVAPLELALGQMQQSVDDLVEDVKAAQAQVSAVKGETVDERILTSAAPTVFLSTVAGFSTYRVSILARSDQSAADRQALRMRINGDDGMVYDTLRTLNDDGTLSAIKSTADQWIYVGRIPAAGSSISTNNMGAVSLVLPHARGLTNFKSVLTQWGARVDTGTMDTGTGWGQRRNVAVTTQLRFDLPGSSNFIVGSRFTLEGVATP